LNEKDQVVVGAANLSKTTQPGASPLGGGGRPPGR